MTSDEALDDLAELLAGLQVPLSLGHGLLGAADEPYRRLLGELGFGWRDAEEFRAGLVELLGIELPA